jgi:hypothetical protein
MRYKLQYKQSSLSEWTAANATTTSYNIEGLTPSTNYQFKVRSICEGGGIQSAFSSIAKFKTAVPGTYCAIAGIVDDAYISSVKFGAIDNTSGNNSGYGDYTALNTNLTAGVIKKITLTPGYALSTVREEWEVYIDYNHDGDFTDVGELAGTGANGGGEGIVHINITAPLTALNGKTRMRIIMHDSWVIPPPCFTFKNGEAEDYSVTIVGGASNTIALQSDVQPRFNSIMVSPNPVRGSLASVILQASNAGPVNIKIADLSGRILRSENISGIVTGKNNYSLRNINLLPGTYMIIAQQGNAIIARTQFVVDK